MRVSKIDIIPLRAPLICPFRTTLGQHDGLENILIKIRLDNGIDGQGEAAIAPHITGETVSRTSRNLKKIAAGLTRRDIRGSASTAVWLAEELPDNPAARGGLEMALLDARARTHGVPLWRLFGQKAAVVRTDITIVIDGLPQTRAAVRRFYRRGFRNFKVKIGRDRDLDFKRVLLVCKEAPRSRILLDANQGYTARETIAFLKDLARQGIHPALIEQPVVKDDWDGLAEIRSARLAPVCADESARTMSDCRGIVRRRAADVINIKVMKSGFHESLQIARLARARGLRLMIGGMMESALAMTAAAHFAAGLNCFDFIDLDTPFFIKGPLGQSPYLDSRGVYDVRRAAAGIGVRLEP